MKIQKITLLLVAMVMSLFMFTLSAAPLHNETATIKVYGNCGMCKKRIETALLKNKHVKSASWNVESKMLTVVYDPHMINVTVIHKIVADAGHDTDTTKATDTNYSTLPGCCKYDRKK